MGAKEFLDQYAEAQRIAERMKTEYDKEAALLDSIRSPLGGDGQPKGGGVSSPIERKAVRLAEKLTEYEEAVEDAERIKRRVLRTINKVPGAHGSLLYERYINLRSWRQVADALHYSKRHCFTLHNEALDIVEDLIKS